MSRFVALIALMCGGVAFATETLIPLAENECTRLLVWFGSPHGGVRMMSRLPRLSDKEKPIRVVLFPSSHITAGHRVIPLYLEEASNEMKRAGGKGLEITVIDTDGFTSLEAVKAEVKKQSQKADVLFFSGHANPKLVAFNEKLNVQGDLFDGMNLEGRTLIFSGCNTANCVWEPSWMAEGGRNWHLRGTRVDPEESLAEGAMRRAKPSFVIGSTRTLDNTGSLDERRLIHELFVHGGGRNVEGYRSMAAVNVDTVRPGDTKASLLKLSFGGEEERLQYLDRLQAWRDYGYDADPAAFKKIEDWISDGKTSPKLRNRAIDFLFSNSGRELIKLVKELPADRRRAILNGEISRRDFGYRFSVQSEFHKALAKGDSSSMDKLARAIPEEDRLSTLMRLFPRRTEDIELAHALSAVPPAFRDPELGKIFRLAAWMGSQPDRLSLLRGISLKERVKEFLSPAPLTGPGSSPARRFEFDRTLREVNISLSPFESQRARELERLRGLVDRLY